MGLKIISLAKHQPKNIVTNKDLEATIDTDSQWIKQRTGIESRYVSKIGEDTSRLAIEAAKKLEISDPDKIDLIIVASFSQDLLVPNIASMVQLNLGLKEEIMAFDFNMACTGFVGGLRLCESILQAGRQAIIVGAEVISKLLDDDRSVAILFGDGAGAALVEKNDAYMAFDIGNRPSFDKLHCHGHTVDEDVDKYLRMDGRAVYRFATDILKETIDKTLDNYSLAYEDIDYYVCHQANKRIIDSVRKKMGLDEDKFFINLEKYANTSAASIPIALSEMKELDLVKPGTKTVLAGFGGGLSWASTLIEW